jgi:hypothetical protein
MTTPDLPITLLSLALLAGCAALGLLLARLRRLQKSLAEYRKKLDLAGSEPAGDTTGEFRSSLLEATLKQRLEKGADWRRPPEKYRYAAALAEQGADAERIAELLQLPLPEVRQLIALSKVKGGPESRVSCPESKG